MADNELNINNYKKNHVFRTNIAIRTIKRAIHTIININRLVCDIL